uniref:Uncharacterized protein n=1 Tax=Romanomermis culicivorax TaxID=13658 RepID=A0A915HNX5_ROMCU
MIRKYSLSEPCLFEHNNQMMKNLNLLNLMKKNSCGTFNPLITRMLGKNTVSSKKFNCCAHCVVAPLISGCCCKVDEGRLSAPHPLAAADWLSFVDVGNTKLLVVCVAVPPQPFIAKGVEAVTGDAADVTDTVPLNNWLTIRQLIDNGTRVFCTGRSVLYEIQGKKFSVLADKNPSDTEKILIATPPEIVGQD